MPSASEAGQELHGLSSDALREAERHVASCGDCGRRVSKYRQLVSRPSYSLTPHATPGADCPKGKDVDWHEVAAGLWPEFKAKQLIMHAALCDQCGPQLRAATSANDDPTPQEERLLSELRAPSRPEVEGAREPVLPVHGSSPFWRRFLRWRTLAPVTALILFVVVVTTIRSSRPLSGPEYAEFAINTHRQFAQGSLALDLHSDSQQTLNEWLREKSKFPLVLPASPTVPGEERPYVLQGARLVQVAGKTAAYIAYQMQTGPVSLMVTPDTVAVASGGFALNFKKVSFHYSMAEGYKVVTWSQHGLTYALVSQEGNNTQGSCMVCHSAMRDRDLSHTPTPLRSDSSQLDRILQSLHLGAGSN